MLGNNIYIYICIFIIPAVFLFTLSIFIYMRSSHRKDGLLLGTMSLFIGMLFFSEFIRHNAPSAHVPFLTQFLIGSLTIATLSVALHLAYILSTKKNEFKLPYTPVIFYSVFPIHIIVSLIFPLTENNFYRNNIWVYRDAFFYDVWLLSIIGIFISANIIVLYVGKERTKDYFRKKLLNYLANGLTLIGLTFLLLNIIIQSENLPPVQTLMLGCGTAILVAIGIYNYNLSPSIVDRYKIIFDLSPAALAIVNSNLEIIEMNSKARELFPNIRKTTIENNFQSEMNQKNINKMFNELIKHESLTDYLVELEEPAENKLFTISISASIFTIGDDVKYLIMWRDVSKEIEQERLIEKMAFYDSLTNIYNRTYFVPEASKVIQKYIGSSKIAALISIDLNYFKFINDTYGHAIGDLVLVQTANILKEAIPEYNPIIARLGGDEFVLLIEDIPSKEAIHPIILQIRNIFNESPFENNQIRITISPSVGYALIPEESIQIDELLQIADLRMYEDKTRIKTEKNR